MFNLFKSNKNNFPVKIEDRKYFEQNLLWLETQFPDSPIKDTFMILPTNEFFPFNWSDKESDAFETLKVLCK